MVYYLVWLSLPLKLQMCTLDVLLDPGLLLESSVVAVTRSSFCLQLNLLYQLPLYLDKGNLAKVTCALVTSMWNYCNGFYVVLPFKTVWKLHFVYNCDTVTMLLWRRGTRACYSCEKELHLLPTVLQVQWKMLIITVKVLNCLWSSYQKDCFSHMNLLSPGEGLLCVPPPATESEIWLEAGIAPQGLVCRGTSSMELQHREAHFVPSLVSVTARWPPAGFRPQTRVL